MNLQRTLSGGSLRVLALPMKTAEVEGPGGGVEGGGITLTA